MKKKWLQSLGGVDDEYVLEAAPTGAVRRRAAKSPRMLAILAACLCFVLLCGTFALFIPYKTTPPSVEKYADSEYYGVIQKLNEYYYEPPKYKNTAELLLDLPSNLFAKVEDMAPGASNEADNMNGTGNYQEVTDNQVAGVIEADRIKRSDTHIYYLADEQLYIYSIAGEQSEQISCTDLRQYGLSDLYAEEFFLSKDCNTVTVLCHYMYKTKNTYTPYVKIVTLDVSDPASVKEISNVDVSGSYLSSRLTEHGLLVMTTMQCRRKIDFDDTKAYIPSVEQDGEMQFIAPDDIVCPETLSNASYTVMLLMNDIGTEVKDTAAYLSYSQDVYVSKSAVYATRQYTEYGQTVGGKTPYYTVSEISCISYGADGFEKRGSVIVDGYVLDQYSMDEYENTLRVVTTTSEGVKRTHSNSSGSSNMEMTTVGSSLANTGNTSANLYVIDLATMQPIASVLQFAPKGETVRSARFDGTQAYVCTAVQQTDPVFFFDLSDLSGITVKETGTIAGFSTSLVNFGDGFLLGIGQGDEWHKLKLEIYVEGEDGVESYCKYERPFIDYYPDYKCYYIDRENGLIGMGIHTWDKIALANGVYKWDNYRYGYIVLHFDGKNLREVLHLEFTGNLYSLDEMRGVYIDGYYYVLGGTNFNVEPLELPEK